MASTTEVRADLELARERLFEDPAAAPAAILEHVQKQLGWCSLTQGVILALREEVRRTIDRGYDGKANENNMMTVKKEEGQAHPTSTKAEREQYLREWAMAQRHPVTREAKAELRRRFGIGIGTDDYSRILREVDRRKRELEQIPVTAVAPRPHTLDDVVRLGRAIAIAGISSIRVDREGNVLGFERFEK